MRLYLAGPMTGYELWNFPAFEAARIDLREAGYAVHCPAEEDLARGFNPYAPVEDFTEYDYLVAMRRDIVAVRSSDGVAVLPGWSKSNGARMEVSAALALGIPVKTVEEWLA